jgi:hypothetical protein
MLFSACNCPVGKSGARYRFDRIPVILSAAGLDSAGNRNWSAPKHSPLFAGMSVSLPAKNPIPQDAWIDLQRIAHAQEGERSASPVVENPGLDFPEFLPPLRTVRVAITLKGSHRVDKNAGHQARYRFGCCRTAPCGIKLRGHDGIGEKRKFIARRTHQIDSRTWIVHDSPAFTGCHEG